jgi:tetratricopeptide (TPR) repeat protein
MGWKLFLCIEVLQMSQMQTDAEHRLQQADDLYTRGDLGGAYLLYQETLALNPGCVPALSRLGAICAQQGRLDEAEEYLQAALSFDSRYAPALSNLGNVFYQRSHFEMALKLYRQAADLDSDNPVYLTNMHAAYKRLGQHAQAVKALKQASRARKKQLQDANRAQARRLRQRLGCGATAVVLFVLLNAMLILRIP